MFEDREFGAARTSAFVADYFTLTNAGKVKYLGADGPRLGIFVVDVGGGPRAMVGPVATGYEAETGIDRRLDDERALTHAVKASPWRTSFAVAKPVPPPIGLVGRFIECVGDGGPVERRIALRAERRIGKVSVTLLDHHADPLGSGATVDVDTTWKTVAFSLPRTFATASFGVEGLHVHVHDLSVVGLPTRPLTTRAAPVFLRGRSRRTRHCPSDAGAQETSRSGFRPRHVPRRSPAEASSSHTRRAPRRVLLRRGWARADGAGRAEF